MTVRELRKILKDFKDPNIDVRVISGGFGEKEIKRVDTSYVRYEDGVDYLCAVIYGD